MLFVVCDAAPYSPSTTELAKITAPELESSDKCSTSKAYYVCVKQKSSVSSVCTGTDADPANNKFQIGSTPADADGSKYDIVAKQI